MVDVHPDRACMHACMRATHARARTEAHARTRARAHTHTHKHTHTHTTRIHAPQVDLDLDTDDFGRLTSLGTLFRTVGEQLLHGGRQGRIACLRELAQQAPQALCSIALHVPFDVLVRELDGVCACACACACV